MVRSSAHCTLHAMKCRAFSRGARSSEMAPSSRWCNAYRYWQLCAPSETPTSTSQSCRKRSILLRSRRSTSSSPIRTSGHAMNRHHSIEGAPRFLGVASVNALPPPRRLTVDCFQVDSDEYAILSFPIPSATLPSELTGAERSVAMCVLEGCSNSEIALRRGTSIHTVANQLRGIFSKLRVSGRMELVRRCSGAKGSTKS
ncbi:MAG: helix-turn-helix transcriptional regulator [Myxococcota bacterium]